MINLIFNTGLFWRYLKIVFAYDHADYKEFMYLKILQTYIQSLPLTAIHFAWLIVCVQVSVNNF